jgi:inhibitor of KinA sporulation pathway (predicted exonuclease)
MARIRRDRALYLDLEMTCWEDGVVPEGFYAEIIQIGIVEVDTVSLKLTREGSYYVQPTVSPVSEYCTQLTGITQRHVDRQGRPFYEVLNSIERKYGPKNKACFVWGDDQKAIEMTCDADEIVSPFAHFMNLSLIFGIEMGVKESKSLPDALTQMHDFFTGRQHDALVDAKNTANLHIAMMRRMRA